MKKGLMVSTTKVNKRNQAKQKTFFFESVKDGERFIEENKDFVFFSQKIDIVEASHAVGTA